MRIALINLILRTIDRPEKTSQLFGAALETPIESNDDIHFIKLSRAIAKKMHEVTLFGADIYKPIQTSNESERLKIDYLKSRCRWLFPTAYCPFTPSLYRKIKRGNFDIIQSSDFLSWGTFLTSLASRRLLVWQEMDCYPTRFLPRLISKIFYKTIGRLIANRITFIPRSSSAAKFLESLSCSKVLEPIHSGVDIMKFHPLNLEEEYLLVVSRLAHDKGFDFLLEAFKKIVDQKPTIKLLIKGDGPYYESLLTMIESQGLKKQVTVDQRRSDHLELNTIYNRAFLTVISGLGGLLPFTAYESLAAGKPVVSRFARGLKDVIISGQTGYITTAPDEMADKVLWLLDHPAEKLRMGESAHVLMREYDLTQIATKLVTCYEKTTREISNRS